MCHPRDRTLHLRLWGGSDNHKTWFPQLVTSIGYNSKLQLTVSFWLWNWSKNDQYLLLKMGQSLTLIERKKGRKERKIYFTFNTLTELNTWLICKNFHTIGTVRLRTSNTGRLFVLGLPFSTIVEWSIIKIYKALCPLRLYVL